MAIQCLVKYLMENYSQFLNMTSQCNKYHVNIWLIRRISSGLRFKSFPASWLKVLATVFLNKLEFWSGSKDKTET